jgi:hypothetical protein
VKMVAAGDGVPFGVLWCPLVSFGVAEVLHAALPEKTAWGHTPAVV